MTSRQKIEAIERLLSLSRCSDGGCIYGHPGGMATNGGCMSTKGSQIETRHELTTFLRALRDILAKPEDTNNNKDRDRVLVLRALAQLAVSDPNVGKDYILIAQEATEALERIVNYDYPRNDLPNTDRFAKFEVE